MIMVRPVKGISLAVGVAALAALGAMPVGAGEGFSPHVDSSGDIRLPANFRLSMVHLGSWFVPDGDASGFHDVYTEKETVEVYRKTGKFPDGATLVKELRAGKAADYTTGKGVSHATDGLSGQCLENTPLVTVLSD